MNTPQKFWLTAGLLLIAATVIMPPWTTTSYKVLTPHVYPTSPFSNSPRYSAAPQQVIDSSGTIGPFQYSLMDPPRPQTISDNWQASVNGGLLLLMLAIEAIATTVLVKSTASAVVKSVT